MSTALDALWGYRQVIIKDENEDKTTFTSDLDTHHYNRMSFDSCNNAATSHRALNILSPEVTWKTCLVCIDDVVIVFRNSCQHARKLIKLLTLLHHAEMTLELPKCHFSQKNIAYLDYILLPGCKAADFKRMS